MKLRISFKTSVMLGVALLFVIAVIGYEPIKKKIIFHNIVEASVEAAQVQLVICRMENYTYIEEGIFTKDQVEDMCVEKALRLGKQYQYLSSRRAGIVE